MSSPTFGAQIATLAPNDLLAAEATTGRSEYFAPLDTLINAALRHALADKRLVDVTYGRRGVKDTAALAGDLSPHRGSIDDRYLLERQESRGAWYVPQELSLKTGVCNLPALTLAQPRFAMTAVRDEVVKVDARACRDAVAIWAALVPLFTDLFAAIEYRTGQTKLGSVDDRRTAWRRVEATYDDLGLCLDEVAPFRFGGDWGRLRVDDQVAAREALLDGLRRAVNDETGPRWRARVIKALAAAYYAKARSGRPLSRAVLTKAVQPHLSAAFGGDWIAFLDYLEEKPNDGESIATALPEPRLFVGAAAKTADVAADAGLAVDEVERMLAAYLGHAAGTSPVEERVAVMRRWWEEFDGVHAAQRSGMPALWGLVDEGFITLDNEQDAEPYLYRRLLSEEVVAEVDRLWDGVTLPRWPERIVSEFHPHRQMADAFGPALAFWSGVALTCWFICEGPASRTSIDGLEDYHQRQLVALDELGTPVDRRLFRELEAAESRLGPETQMWRDETVDASDASVIMSVRTGGYTRRDGFEILNEIVTGHRRAWSSVHLDDYLRLRWDGELREVAREYNRGFAARSKPPTIKQFASFAAPAANHWFGGDLAALYAALGEKAPVRTTRVDLLTGDPLTFVRTVYAGLGGGPSLPREAAWQDRDAANRQWDLRRLATEALIYLQLAEALGAPPTPEQFKADRLRWEALGGLEVGWPRFQAAVEAARVLPRADPVPAVHRRIDPSPPVGHKPERAAPADPQLPPVPDAPREREAGRRWIDRLRRR